MPRSLTVALISPVEQSIPVEETSHKLRMPRYGVLPITGALRDAGHRVRLFCEYSGSRVDWDYVLSCDVVLFSLMSFSAVRGYAMAARVRERSRAPVVIGGAHASVAPSDCLAHADYVVRNEGEATLLELLVVIETGGDRSAVAGLSWREPGGAIRHNPSRPFIEDLNRPVDLRWIDGYAANKTSRILTDAARLRFPRLAIPIVQSSRGCVYGCEFCMVKHEFGRRMRFRDPAVVVDEAVRAFEAAGNRMLFIADNDFGHDEDHALAVLDPLVRRYDGRFDLYFFACVDVARRERLLALLSRIRSAWVGIGLESIDDSTLREYRKGHKETQIASALERLSRTDLRILAFFIFSGEQQGVADIRRTVDFAIERRFFNISLCSLTDYPARERDLGLRQVFPDHRFIHKDWRFYNGNFVLHFPRNLPPSVLQREIRDGYRRFYAANRTEPYQYKAWMATVPDYLRFLREAERDLYDAGGALIEERLAGRVAEDLPARIDVRVPAGRLLAERARFFALNLARPSAWRLAARLAPGRRVADPNSLHA